MESTTKLKGVIVPMITPWHEGEFDKYSFVRIGDYIFNGGADGILDLGATAELPRLTFETKKEKIDVVANAFCGLGKKLLVCTNGNTLEETCTLSLHAAGKRGIDALVIAPMYQPYGYLESVGYKSAVEYLAEVIKVIESERVAVPILLYNNPQLTSKDIPPQDVKALAREPRIIGIKDSSGNLEYFSWLMTMQSPDFSILQGNEKDIKQSLEMEADGFVCGSGNIYPRFMVNLFNEGDAESFQILGSIVDRYKAAGDAVKVIKEIAHKEGLIRSPELVSY